MEYEITFSNSGKVISRRRGFEDFQQAHDYVKLLLPQVTEKNCFHWGFHIVPDHYEIDPVKENLACDY